MESKISFGFKKLPTKTTVIGAKPPQEKKLDLIECLDGQSIKIIGHVEEEEIKPLVIPMQGANKNLLDRIKDANELKERSKLKYQKKEEPEDLRPDCELTIEELAARKLLEEAKDYGRKKTATKVMTIAVEDQLILEGAKESTIDDYESVPIGDFGYAMLRGMGWSDEQAQKKKLDAPALRPKGMGLGASITGQKNNKPAVDKDGNELRLVKGAKAKIIAGKEKGSYCTVQGLDDDSGRVIVKTTLQGTVLSLNEFMLLPVTNDEYIKSSKVINNAKYEKYKEKETTIKTEKEVKREMKPVKVKEENGDDVDISGVEYVPNKNGVKIELSSDSENETSKPFKTHNKWVKVNVKEEHNHSRERDLKSSMNSKSRPRSRSRSRSKNRKTHKSRRSSRSSSSDRATSRNKSKSNSQRGRDEKYSKLKSSSSRSRKDKDNKDYTTDESSDSEYERHRNIKKTKSKKSKSKSSKKKKDKKSKKKSRSRRSSDSDSV